MRINSKKKLIIIALLLIIWSLAVLFVVTGGVYFEHFERYMPIKSTKVVKGKFTPNFIPGVKTDTLTIIPYLMYFRSITPDYNATISLSDNTSVRNYDKIKYVTFKTIQIRFENGKKRNIIPGDKDIPYYSHLSKGTKLWNPYKDELSRKKFIVCKHSSKDCFGLIGSIDIKNKGPFTVIIEGSYETTAGIKEDYYYEQKWSQEDHSHMTSGWEKLASV